MRSSYCVKNVPSGLLKVRHRLPTMPPFLIEVQALIEVQVLIEVHIEVQASRMMRKEKRSARRFELALPVILMAEDPEE